MGVIERFYGFLDFFIQKLKANKSKPLFKQAYSLCMFLLPSFSAIRRLSFSLIGKADYSSESSFFEAFFSSNDKDSEFVRNLRLNKGKRKIFYPPNFTDFISKSKNQKPLVLEIGAGPLSTLAYGVDEGVFKVVAIDPLGDVYENILKKHNLSYPIQPIKMEAEEISGKFKPNSFDVAYMCNSLDHTNSPEKVLRNCILLLRKSGYVYIEGFVNEGSNQNWYGLHRHNLFLKKGHLYWATQSSKPIDLSQKLRLKPVYSEIIDYKKRFPREQIDKKWFIAAFQK